MKHKATLSTLILVTTAAAAYWAFAQANDESAGQMPQQAQQAQRQSISADQLLQQELRRQQSDLQPMLASQVSSLNGSYPDGAVNLDERGQVIADKDLHRLFDHYLSAQGEMSLDEIKHRLLSVSSDFLSLNQLEQVRDLFDQYVNYLAESENFALSMASDLSLKERLMAVEAHREQMLGKSLSEAFFGEAHAYARWVMALDAGEDIELTPQQARWLAQEDAATAYQDVWLEQQQMKLAGLSQQQKLNHWQDIHGTEVAERLNKLDQQQTAWQQQVQSYIAERQQLQGDPSAIARLDSQYDDRTLKRLHVWYANHLSQG